MTKACLMSFDSFSNNIALFITLTIISLRALTFQGGDWLQVCLVSTDNLARGYVLLARSNISVELVFLCLYTFWHFDSQNSGEMIVCQPARLFSKLKIVTLHFIME